MNIQIKTVIWIPGIVCAGFMLLAYLGVWHTWDREFGDLLFNLRLKIAPLQISPRIFPVDLNDSAVRNLGPAVDNREAFADLLQILGNGGLVGGMDFIFFGLKSPVGDRAMVQAASNMEALVLAVVPIDAEITKFSGRNFTPEEAKVLRAHLWYPKVINKGSIPVASTFLLPNIELAKHSLHLGHIGGYPDTDGLYRKSCLFFQWEGGYVPSLALALAVSFLRLNPAQITIDAGNEVKLVYGDKVLAIPIDHMGCVWIPYPDLWVKTWKRIPLDRVVAATKDPDLEDELLNLWDGGIVIAADITTTHKDFGSTPVEAIYPLSGIHTSIINGILTGALIDEYSQRLKLIVTAILILCILWVNSLQQIWKTHLGFTILIILLAVWAIWSWFGFLIRPWFISPGMGVLSAWLATILLQLFYAHKKRILIENALTRYFPRALAARILKENRTDLLPVNKELTILFSDIVGFTKWSSDKDSALVHKFLNDYLEAMARILFAHGGTVDKFMGDGILAFFNDPWEQPDHAKRCLNAALEMQAKVKELKMKWQPLGDIDLKVRIGINTGRVIVGNLGSLTRIEYTVIGAPVNLAQRMESNAPPEGILVARDTWELTKAEFEFGQCCTVSAKGYSTPIDAYVLQGLKT